MDEAIPIVGSPRLTSYDLLLWTAELHAIEYSEDWDRGNYTSPPAGAMDTVADIDTLNATTPAYRVSHASHAGFPAFLTEIQESTLNSFDVNNWVRSCRL